MQSEIVFWLCAVCIAEERCLGVDEKPLLVQLNWHKDDREGRSLLRRADEKSTLSATQPPEESSFRVVTLVVTPAAVITNCNKSF